MKLYTAPYCPKCEVAVTAQNEAGINFTLVKDTQEAIAIGLRSVPVLVTDAGEQLGLPAIIAMCRKEDGRHE